MNNTAMLVDMQRAYFNAGATKSVEFRLEQLKKLKEAILRNRENIYAALKKDLNKSRFEAYESEVAMVMQELHYVSKNLAQWAKPKLVYTPVIDAPGISHIHKEPYGVVLIMAPWNYPFQLAMLPLIGAIAAGNCAIVKPSNYAPATSGVVSFILESCFEKEYVAAVTGGREANASLLENQFDYIFFTGGTTVGKLVMEAAAKHLTPVSLELGGKSPCIVDETAALKISAQRIAWGKCLNAGQTCVAPDYLLVHRKVKDEFLGYLTAYIKKYFGAEPQNNPDYPKIINEKHFNRIRSLITSGGTLVCGGQANEETLQLAPAVIDNVTWDMNVMQEEIFGPVLPVIVYDDIHEIIEKIQSRPKPLALYLFTRSKKTRDLVMESCSFGGGCVNEVVTHMINHHLPFGGVGESGMGQYHGKYSFDTFTHEKSILHKSSLLEPFVRYAPYNKVKLTILKFFMH